MKRALHFLYPLTPVGLMWLVILLGFLCGGCASAPEKTLAISFETVNLAVKIEHDNRDFYRAEAPEFHRWAEQMRQEFPRTWRYAYGLVGTYRQLKTAAAKGEMDAAVADVVGLATEARKYLREHYREK